MATKLGTLLAGVALLATGLADALSRQHLGLPIDFVLIAAGSGALGVHVNLQ